MSLTIYAKRKERKKKQLEELGNLLSKYSNFVVLSIAGVETPTLQKLRNSIRGKAELKVVKNTLFFKSARSNKPIRRHQNSHKKES